MHFAGKKRQCLQLYALSKRVKWMMITLLVPPDLTVRGNRTFGKRASSICPPPPTCTVSPGCTGGGGEK